MNRMRVPTLALIVPLAFLNASCAMFFPPKRLRAETPAAIVLRSGPGRLEAGAARADITPRGDILLGGFGILRRSRGVHDPLWARALAVRIGSLTTVLVAVDLVGFHNHDVEDVRARLADLMPPDAVMVAATHTHSGPDTLGLWGLPPFCTGRDCEYLEHAKEGIAAAARAAVSALGPARLRWGRTQAPAMGVSRNIREPMLIDRTVTALAFERPDGAPVATLVHFACHPEILGRRNRLVSADFAAALCGAIEREKGGGTAVFLNGALGGMVTGHEKVECFEEAERIGGDVARAALEAIAGAGAPLEESEFVCVRQRISVPIQNWRYHLGNFFSLFGSRPFTRDGFTPSEVWGLRLGSAVLLTAPGEVLPRLGFELAERAGAADPFLLVGLGNDELGYVIHEEDFGRKLYSYERTVSAGPLLATLLRRTAAEVLEKLQGK